MQRFSYTLLALLLFITPSTHAMHAPPSHRQSMYSFIEDCDARAFQAYIQEHRAELASLDVQELEDCIHTAKNKKELLELTLQVCLENMQPSMIQRLGALVNIPASLVVYAIQTARGIEYPTLEGKKDEIKNLRSIVTALENITAHRSKNLFDLIQEKHGPTIIDEARPIPDFMHEEDPSIPDMIDTYVKDQLNPPRTEKFKQVCTLLAQSYVPHEEPIDEGTQNDLNLLAGSHGAPLECLVEKLDRTKTMAGRITLCSKLLHPLSSRNALSKQKTKIEQLEQQYESFQEIFHEAESAENGFLSFLQKDDQFEYQLIRGKNKLLGAEKVAMLKQLETMCNEHEISLFIQEAAPITIELLVQGKKIAVPLYALATWDAPLFFESVGMTLMVDPNSPFGLAHSVAKLTTPKKFAKFLGYSLGTYQQGSEFVGAFESMRNRLCELRGMQKKLLSFKKFMHILKRTKQHIDAMQGMNELSSALDVQTSEEVRRLNTLLASNTFQGKEAMLSNWGNIKAAYKLIGKCKNELLPAYKALGEIDCMLNSATLHKENPEHFCIPEYLFNQAKPKLLAHSYWNPFLDQDEAVCNSIAIGEKFRAGIVTGKNGQGKTTNTTLALLLAALMSQTMCIAPAKRFMYTPFGRIATIIKNETNIGAHRSLFESVAQHAGTILQIMQNEPGFKLITLDEPFAGGTHDELARQSAYVLTEEVGMDPNVLSMTTTHLKELTQLAHTDPGIFANFRAADGFRIEPGVGESDIGTGLDILTERCNSNFAQKIKRRLEAKGINC